MSIHQFKHQRVRYVDPKTDEQIYSIDLHVDSSTPLESVLENARACAAAAGKLRVGLEEQVNKLEYAGQSGWKTTTNWVVSAQFK